MTNSFKVMLASQDPPDLTQLRYPCYIQPKIDGFRAIYIPGVGFLSRACKPFRNGNLGPYFRSLEAITDHVLDGELYIHGIEFQNLASTVSKEGAPILGLKYVIYDCLPLKDFNNQVCDLVYEGRLKLLRALINHDITDYTKVIDIPTDKISSPKEIKDLYKNYLQEGYEGVIIRRVDGKYKFGRSTLKGGELIKLKPFKSVDLKVVDVFEGTGQFEEKLGGIVCNLASGNTVSVGSGFTHVDREKIWLNKQDYIGKTAEIKYLELTEDNSLRHPIFMRFREDK